MKVVKNELNNRHYENLCNKTKAVIESFEAEIRASERKRVIKELEEQGLLTNIGNISLIKNR